MEDSTVPQPTSTEAVVATTETSSDATNNDKKREREEKKQYAPSLKRMVFGLGKYLDNKKFEKILQGLNVEYDKVRKVPGNPWGIIFFATEELAATEQQKIQGQVIDGKTLDCKLPEDKKEKQARDKKPKKGDDSEPKKPISVALATAPWSIHDYEKQIEMKREAVKANLKSLIKLMRSEAPTLPEWYLKRSHAGNKEFCPVEDVLRSPVREYYRNKVSFTMGIDDNEQPCIGFAKGRILNNVDRVGDPSECLVLSAEAMRIRNEYQKFVQNSEQREDYSKQRMYDKHSHLGFWREMVVKTFSTGEVMCVFQVSDVQIDPAAVQKERENLRIFTEKLTHPPQSVWFQIYNGISNVAPDDCPMDLIHGSQAVHENLMGLKFRISPNAFFQVNTQGANQLYTLVKDWCLEILQGQQKNEKTEAKTPDGGVETSEKKGVVLDVCCGTGTIGICLAPHVKEVIGIEMVSEAVDDARENAKLNGVENISFLKGKAEDVFHKTTTLLPSGCIAVLDPPRAGLHPAVVKSIRSCSKIEYIVFVSCDKASLTSNVMNLCKRETKTYSGKPFVPIKCMGVDLFPHTPNVEVVIMMKREE
ncbi:hypothetical protein PROFUN_13915 [Planoprotostelium fungivorum]|uniref:Methyltransferase domain-containing protein n=1 Tax=Planoprotostelium fungivorum TaxID=1890364 RepID=A0A2P6N2V5_9EUKA|nr:hypothetical protein PROFUN_13915 [Planoprotostelium fungivorum]